MMGNRNLVKENKVQLRLKEPPSKKKPTQWSDFGRNKNSFGSCWRELSKESSAHGTKLKNRSDGMIWDKAEKREILKEGVLDICMKMIMWCWRLKLNPCYNISVK